MVAGATLVPGSVSLADMLDLVQQRPLALMLGNEHAGLSPAATAACDVTFTIPMYGLVDSFNVSVAAALSLQQALHARAAVTVRDVSEQEAARVSNPSDGFVLA